jgi:hypothetical protein
MKTAMQRTSSFLYTGLDTMAGLKHQNAAQRDQLNRVWRCFVYGVPLAFIVGLIIGLCK